MLLAKEGTTALPPVNCCDPNPKALCQSQAAMTQLGLWKKFKAARPVLCLETHGSTQEEGPPGSEEWPGHFKENGNPQKHTSNLQVTRGALKGKSQNTAWGRQFICRNTRSLRL